MKTNIKTTTNLTELKKAEVTIEKFLNILGNEVANNVHDTVLPDTATSMLTDSVSMVVSIMMNTVAPLDENTSPRDLYDKVININSAEAIDSINMGLTEWSKAAVEALVDNGEVHDMEMFIVQTLKEVVKSINDTYKAIGSSYEYAITYTVTCK